MKKVLGLFLAAAMCFFSVSAFAYTDYADVEEEYVEITDVLSSLKVMEGFEDGSFRPDDTLTRSEAAAIIVRLLGDGEKDEIFEETVFSDVDESHWAAGYIAVAKEKGIINGMGDGTFDPEGFVTYHQFVKMLVCALGYEPVADANDGWSAGGYLYAAHLTGLIKSANVNNWVLEKGVDAPVTRIIAAEMVYNALEIELLDESDYYTGINGTCWPHYDDDETILTEYLGYSMIKGVVTKVSEDGKTVEMELTESPRKAESPFEKGNKYEFENFERNVSSFVGLEAVAYVKDGKLLKCGK